MESDLLAQTDLTSSLETLQNYDTIDSLTKDRVRAVDHNYDHCMVTNYPEDCSVQFCHCIDRKYMKHSKVLDSLEWHWNMDYGTLNLDTKYNIFRAEVGLHNMFDGSCWLLMPEDDIIQQYFANLTLTGNIYYADRETFPDIPNRPRKPESNGEGPFFLYRLVRLCGMELLRISRNNSISPSDDGYITHVYPFTTLRLLKSHLHPKFAIVNAGRKLQCLENKVMQHLVAEYPSLAKLNCVYSAWLRLPPQHSSTDPSFHPTPRYHGNDSGDDNGGDDSGDGDDPMDNRTERGWPPLYRGAPPSPTPNKCRRTNGLSGSGRKLSTLALDTHTRAVGNAKWRDRVQKWSERNGQLQGLQQRC